jgi:hypothetical protein
MFRPRALMFRWRIFISSRNLLHYFMENSHSTSVFKQRAVLGAALRGFTDVYRSGEKTIATAIASIRNEDIFDPVDIAVLVFIVALYKPLLMAMYKVSSLSAIKYSGKPSSDVDGPIDHQLDATC